MRYHNVQGLRAIAASLVVIAHSGCVMYVPNAMMPLGLSGVDLFFVISGFIICQVATKQRTNSLHFFTRRCWRIFPVYWIVLTFSVLINAFGLSTASWMSSEHPALDYILLLSTENRYLPQAWSLVFELYFYASVFLVLLVSPEGRFYRTLAVWLVMQTFLISLCGSDGAPPVNALSLEFGLGCVVAWLNVRNLIRYELIVWAVGILLFAVGEWWFVNVAPVTSIPRFLTFGIGAAASLYAMVGLERRGACLFPKIVQRLGDASYSLYLWHVPLLVVAMTVGIRNGAALSLIFSAAFVSYYWIEAPLVQLDGSDLARRLVSGATFIARRKVASLIQRLDERLYASSSRAASP